MESLDCCLIDLPQCYRDLFGNHYRWSSQPSVAWSRSNASFVDEFDHICTPNLLEGSTECYLRHNTLHFSLSLHCQFLCILSIKSQAEYTWLQPFSQYQMYVFSHFYAQLQRHWDIEWSDVEWAKLFSHLTSARDMRILINLMPQGRWLRQP